MTVWSRWITDPNDVQIFLEDGSDEVYGFTSFPGSGPVDSPAYGYTRGGSDSVGGSAAPTAAVTIGVDCTSMFDGPFFPDAHAFAIPTNYLSLWDGSWRWENPYGTIPDNATADLILRASGAGGIDSFDGDYYIWLDDEMDFSSGHMTGPEYDPAVLISRWSASSVRVHESLTLSAGFHTGISITVPVSAIAARGYTFAVTVAVSPTSDVLSLVDPANGVSLLRSFFLNPRFSIGLKSLPPLRQFPRDDAVGGQPRQGKASRSMQSTARQGWTNTYR